MIRTNSFKPFYKLDIRINTPTLFLPVNETTRRGFHAELGCLTVKNRFVARAGKPGQKYLPMIDQMEVVCTEMKLYRVAEYGGETRVHAYQVQILNENIKVSCLHLYYKLIMY